MSVDGWNTVLVLGGTRSGKSQFAESLVTGAGSVRYVATAAEWPDDEEWSARVAAHRVRRPAHWRTEETGPDPTRLAAVIAEAGPDETLLVDDLGGWAAALLDARRDAPGDIDPGTAAAPNATGDGAPAANGAVAALASAVAGCTGRLILVSPEVGLSVLPATVAGRAFTDLLGETNRAVATACDAVVLVVAGQPVWLKPTAAEVVAVAAAERDAVFGSAPSPTGTLPAPTEPGAAEPGAAQPGTAQPGTAQPGAVAPAAGTPATGSPGAAGRPAAGAPPAGAGTLAGIDASPAPAPVPAYLSAAVPAGYGGPVDAGSAAANSAPVGSDVTGAVPRIGPDMDLPMPDEEAVEAAQALLAGLGVPGAGLGELERVVTFAAGTQSTAVPRPWRSPRVLLLHGDHAGGAGAGEPADASARRAAQARAGSGALGALAARAGAEVWIVEAPSSAPMEHGPALPPEAVEEALAYGWRLAAEAVDAGSDILLIGACGTGTEAAATAVLAANAGAEPAAVLPRVVVPGSPGRSTEPDGRAVQTGPAEPDEPTGQTGPAEADEPTGQAGHTDPGRSTEPGGHTEPGGKWFDDVAWMTRCAAVRDALHRTRHHSRDARDVLAELGGGDVAVATGILLGATARRVPVLLDGPVGVAAALVSRDFAGQARHWCLLPDHGRSPLLRQAADVLGLPPFTDLRLDLGEGTTALATLPLLTAALVTATAATQVGQDLAESQEAEQTQTERPETGQAQSGQAETERPETERAQTERAQTERAREQVAERQEPARTDGSADQRANDGE